MRKKKQRIKPQQKHRRHGFESIALKDQKREAREEEEREKGRVA